ncbi:putative ribonuclease H-like domain-containing protein [Tanacetum coccineum]
MSKYVVTHRHATTPLITLKQRKSQVNGVQNQVCIRRILERTVGENRASWSDKLDDALWAFRTAFKTPIGCTPYKTIELSQPDGPNFKVNGHRVKHYFGGDIPSKSNGFASKKASDNACQARNEIEPVKNYILLPLWTADPPFSHVPKSSHDDGFKPSSDDGKKVEEDPRKDSKCNDQEKEDNVNNTNYVNAASTNEDYDVGGKISIELTFDPNMPSLEDYTIFDTSRNDEDDGAEADMNNLDTTIKVSLNPTTRLYKDHPLDQVIGDLQSAIQIRKMSKNLEEHRKNPKSAAGGKITTV